MSGPKDYSPPPRYSINVFSGSLNSVFVWQSQVRELALFLKNAHIDDDQLNIHLDCKNELKALASAVNQLLEPLVFNYKGTFDQATYNKIEAEINEKLNKLTGLHSQLQMIKVDFDTKKEDYKSYLNYLKFNEHSKQSFNDFKNSVRINYQADLEKENPELFEQFTKELDPIKYTLTDDSFAIGFNSAYENKKNKTITHVKLKEGEINTVRSKISGENLSSMGGVVYKKKEDKEITEIKQKITVFIENCEDYPAQKEYKRQLQDLDEINSLSDVYYFKELFDRIKLSEKNRINKKSLNAFLVDLNAFDVRDKLKSEYVFLTKRISHLLGQSRIRTHDIESSKQAILALVKKNDELIKESNVAEKERLFLKMQIVTTLKNLGYDVMDDLNVIDFEKNNDYTLKVNGQDNCINLKFKEDGTVKYFFQIPEKVDELSVDQKKQRLEEMDISCTQFKGVLADLKEMGLPMKMSTSKDTREETLLSFTKSTKTKMDKKVPKKSTKEADQSVKRKKYLD